MLFKNLKAQSSRSVLTLLALGTLFSAPAYAQNGHVPVFTPANAWTVAATELSSVRGLKGMKLPCVLSNEYDNGYLIRLSGGGGQFLAMAIDFRQNIFVQGKKYETMLSVGGTYVKQATATAYTPSTLIFNLRPLEGFYTSIKNAEDLEITIDSNVMKFALGQLGSKYDALESCYMGGDAAQIKPLVDTSQETSIDSQIRPAPVPKVDAEPAQEAMANDISPMQEEGAPLPITPLAVAKKSQNAAPKTASNIPPAPVVAPLPKSFDDIVKEAAPDAAPVVARPAMPAAVSQVPAPAPAPVTAKAVPIQPPVAMQVLPAPTATPPVVTPVQSTQIDRRVSHRVDVSDTAPVNVRSEMPAVAATSEAPLPVPPAAAKAVPTTAPSQTATPSVPPVVAVPPSTPAPAAPIPATPPQTITVPLKPQPLPASMPVAPTMATSAPTSLIPAEKTWEAKEGEDMKIVLSRWAERAGYDLDWKAAQDGKVVQDMNFTGTFEEAVSQLLAENSAVAGISGHVQTDQGKKDLPSRIVKDAPEPTSKGAPEKAVIPALHMDWNAPEGANIQSIIDQWGSRSNVAIVWQDYMSFPVKEDMSMTGSFEEAIQTLLDQYDGDSPRPVAQLNIDPESGQRTLLMNLQK